MRHASSMNFRYLACHVITTRAAKGDSVITKHVLPDSASCTQRRGINGAPKKVLRR